MDNYLSEDTFLYLCIAKPHVLQASLELAI